MSDYQTVLSKQEKKWIMEQRVTRATDNQEVLIYPMGAERYLSSVLFGDKPERYNLKAEIKDKTVLVIPGYGNTAFLFAMAGAKSITAYDKDPVTIAWLKAFKKYYHYCEHDAQGKPYPSIGELFTALTCWYPPLISLPSGKFTNCLFWLLNPQLLRRTYIFYMLSLVRQAIQLKHQQNFELNKNIQFHVGEINQLHANKQVFDTAFVPYLLGVKNGIEKKEAIVDFIKQMLRLVPEGHVLVNPSRDEKEFYFTGKRYFVTTGYENVQTIPGLENYFFAEDKHWFRTQGLAIFSTRPHKQDA
ncbi:ABC transporter permease [Legionella cardiaca]|uniref:ABC transporter permease n=1 Tax=Legionella cardiaca TaxID=1071983 RepID=A0ABY8APG3_9GAMM|nr:ABC transporter permease [Legionella cardiaca]WED42542.1 ABC transporter permease [Legionella cardiaca]